MQGFRVEGIVLKRVNLGEADRILTVLSKQKGKISVLAKGVRRITSRRAGNVELLNRSLMFLHPAKNFLILTEASVLDTYPKLKEDLTLSTYAFHIIELVDRLTVQEGENGNLYQELVEVLARLSKKPRQILVRAFETKILADLGFATFRDRGIGGVKEILRDLEVLSWDEIEKMEINQKQALELEHVLSYHVERVIEGKLKSKQMLGRL